MNGEFAKLFGAGDDQVLVKKDADQKGNPEVRFYFVPKKPEGLGVCSIAIGWKDDSDDSWAHCDMAFESVTEELARERIQAAFASFMGETHD
jgi:hypothetical protein